MISYKLYLIRQGVSTCIKTSTDPNAIRRAYWAPKLQRQARRFGTGLRITRNGRPITIQQLDGTCYELWLLNPTETTPWNSSTSTTS